jgi:hypothetical protein
MLKIDSVTSYEGDSVPYTGDDGYPTSFLRPAIVAVAIDGTHWHLPNPVKFVYDEDGMGPFPSPRFQIHTAHEISARIEADGFITERHWLKFEPDTRSTEERVADEYELEQLDRMGYSS